MSIMVILGVSLAILGVLLVLAWQIPDVFEQAKKKRQRMPPAVPPKDWQGMAERMEKRVKSMEVDAAALQAQLRDRDKYAQELTNAVAGIKRQVDQEKSWREKEEAEHQKEKKHERSLEEDLNRTREALNKESTERIKQEYELKEVRRVKEELSASGRGLSSRVMDLERQLDSALKELKQLRDENFQLRRKKEDTEWVAKSDYRQLELALKSVRFELDEFKGKFPPSEWPAVIPKAEGPLRGQRHEGP